MKFELSKKSYIKIGILLFSLWMSNLLFCQSSCEVELSTKAYKEYQQASDLFEKRRYTASAEILRKLNAQEPDCADPYFLLGMIAAQKENLSAMNRNFSKVLELCPNYSDARAHYYMGLVHYSYERYEQAAMSFDHFFTLVNELDGEMYEEYLENAESYSYWSKMLTKAYLNPVPFDPKPIPGVSSEMNEYLAYQTIDGNYMYYIREVSQGVDNSSFYKSELDMKVPQFYQSKRQKDGTFSSGNKLLSPFNIEENEGMPTLTSDNKLLYYSITKKEKNNYSNCDIYYSEFHNGEWTELKNAGLSVNTPNTWESQPSITSDGSYLYFASNRPGGFGGTDIWRVRRLPNGDWGRPENLGPTVNTEGNERSPFIHPDGISLYFASDGWEGLGGLDMYFTRVNDSRYQKPLNLGHPINSEGDEFYFGITTNGRKAYFSSNKYSGKGGMDILEFDLYPAVQPQKVTMVKGKVTDENNNPIGGKLELFVDGAKENNIYTIDESEGTFTAVLNPKFDYILIAKKEGYAFHSKLVPKKAHLEDSLLQFQIQPITIGGSYQINDITFESNSSQLNEKSRFVMDAFIEFLRENPTVFVAIEGYTDNVGDSEANKALSEQRARSVYEYLISKRVRPDRLQYKGFGSEKPVASNDTEEGRAKNRRTVFVIIKK